MPDLLAARSQMAMSLGFHIIFAMVGIGHAGADGGGRAAVAAHRRPRLSRSGPPLGQGHRDPLRGRRRLRHRALLRAGAALARLHGARGRRSSACPSRSRASPSSPRPSSSASTSTAGSASRRARTWPRAGRWRSAACSPAVFVVIANAWMNAPTGFRWVDGRAVDIDPIAAMLNPAALTAGAAHDARGLRLHRPGGGGHPRLAAPAPARATPSTAARSRWRC